MKKHKRKPKPIALVVIACRVAIDIDCNTCDMVSIIDRKVVIGIHGDAEAIFTFINPLFIVKIVLYIGTLVILIISNFFSKYYYCRKLLCIFISL